MSTGFTQFNAAITDPSVGVDVGNDRPIKRSCRQPVTRQVHSTASGASAFERHFSPKELGELWAQ